MADSRKRPYPKQFDGQVYKQKKFDFSNASGFRFLIPTKAGGCMIGKGGDVIKRLRSKFNCRIVVPDSQGPERMVILDGDADSIIDFWNEVLSLIKDYISAKECDYINSGKKDLNDDNDIDLRMVVHESQAGALIGKGGERIRHLITGHNMTIIKVYHALCPNSTDRVVRMVSNKENILECLKSMFKHLENQIIKGIRNDYDPNNYDETIASNYGGFISKDAKFSQRSSNNKSGGFFENDHYGGNMPRQETFDHRYPANFEAKPMTSAYYGGSNNRTIPYDRANILKEFSNGVSDLLDGIIRLSSTNDDNQHVARISLPIHLVTAVIGADGQRLSDIRRDSGAHVQLDDDRLSEREELFVIRGTPDQIYKAQCLMQLCARKYGECGSYGY